MAVRSGNSCKVIAVVFLILLSGGECARISEQAAITSSIKEHLDSHQLLSSGATAGLFGRNDVCRSREMRVDGGDAAVDRYNLKFTKLHSLAVEIRDADCTTGCTRKWFELKSRMVHFGSCAVLANDQNEAARKVPERLMEAMNSGNSSLTQVFVDSIDTVTSAMRKGYSDQFPTDGKCKFDPSNLNATYLMEHNHKGDDARDTIHAQLFGQECDAAAAEKYLNGLNGFAKRTASITLKMVEKLYDLTQRSRLAQQGDNMEQQVKNAVDEAQSVVEDSQTGNADVERFAEKLEEAVEIDEALDDDREKAPSALLEDGDLPENGAEWAQFFFSNLINMVLIIGLSVLVLVMLFTTSWGR